MHILLTWMAAVVLHVVTDISSVRDDSTMNLIFGFIMKYFYTSSVVWTCCEAHATFKVDRLP